MLAALHRYAAAVLELTTTLRKRATAGVLSQSTTVC